MPIDSSKFFDSIRIKPNKLSAKQQAQAREASAMCEWPDCKNKGPHRAPKGRTNDKEYWHFCLRSEEHTSELQSQSNLVCRLLLEKKNNNNTTLISKAT